MSVAIGHYIESIYTNGTPVAGTLFQNYFVRQNRTVESKTYVFSPFSVSDTAGARGGDRSEGQLVLAKTRIGVNAIDAIIEEDWLLAVNVWQVRSTPAAELRKITRQIWRLGAPESDDTDITVPLLSPLDAIRESSLRRLSAKFVGAVPETGSLLVG